MKKASSLMMKIHMAAALMNMNSGISMFKDDSLYNDFENDKQRNKKDLSLAQIEKMKSMSPKDKKRYLKEIGKA